MVVALKIWWNGQESNLPGKVPVGFTVRCFNRSATVPSCGQLLGIEPSTVESQSTILPINYSCHSVLPTTGLEPIPLRE